MILPDDYIVFDLETTGFDPIYNEIIEIGALKYHNNELISKFSVLVKPSNSIPPTITNITGITNEMVKKSKRIEEVFPEFIEFIANYPLVAHNSRFDLSFVKETIKKLNLPDINNKEIDTVKLARKYIPNVYNCKLETLKKYFKLDFGSHRSIEDCLTTNYVYQYCKKEASIKV